MFLTLLEMQSYSEIPERFQVAGTTSGEGGAGIEVATEFRDPVAWNIRLYCLTNRIAFKKVAEASSVPTERLYGILRGEARMKPIEFGAIAKALEQPMEFFLKHNS